MASQVPELWIEIRHGQGAHQVHKIGAAPVPNKLCPLTEKGRAQMKRTGGYLRNRFERIDEIFTSTYVRAQQSVNEIFVGAEPRIDSRLDELWHGVLHEYTREELLKLYPEEIEARERLGWFRCTPRGGQNCEEKVADLASFHRMLRADYAGKVVLAVYHGNAILLDGYLLQNLSVEEVERRHEESVCPNASVTVYEGRGNRLVVAEEFLVP